MNPCACETRLTSWLLGDLPPAEAEAIRRHVADCAACRTLARELEPVVAALRQGLAETPAQAPRLYPAQRRRVLSTPYHTRFRRWWSGSHRGLRLAASLTVAAGFAWLAIRTIRPAGTVKNWEIEALYSDAPAALLAREMPDPTDPSDPSDPTGGGGCADAPRCARRPAFRCSRRRG